MRNETKMEGTEDTYSRHKKQYFYIIHYAPKQ